MDLKSVQYSQLRKLAKENGKKNPDLAVQASIELANRNPVNNLKWLKHAYDIKPTIEVKILLAKCHTKLYDAKFKVQHFLNASVMFREIINDGCTDLFGDYGLLLLNGYGRYHARDEEHWKDAAHYSALGLERDPNNYDLRFALYHAMKEKSLEIVDDRPWILKALNENLRGCHMFDTYLRYYVHRVDPDYARPWNHFQHPTRVLFKLFPKYTRLELFTWLLVAKRLGISKDVRTLIATKIAERNEANYSYICMNPECNALVDSAHDTCDGHHHVSIYCHKCSFNHYNGNRGHSIDFCPYVDGGEEYQTKVLIPKAIQN